MVFVETASRFDADVSVRRCDGEEQVNGKSIMQMMMLAATQGTELEIAINGADAGDAAKELAQLVESRFNEE